MQRYAAFLEETEGATLVEVENGFFSYIIQGEQFFIRDFYSAPLRRMGRSREMLHLMQEIAETHKCKMFTCRLPLANKNQKDCLRIYLHLGFVIDNVEHGRNLILRKDFLYHGGH